MLTSPSHENERPIYRKLKLKIVKKYNTNLYTIQLSATIVFFLITKKS